MIKNKTCTKCKKVKDLTEFSKCRSAKDGLQSRCKQCDKQYRQDNRERRLEYNKQWRQDNAEHIKQYRQDNAERIKQWRQDNAERIKQYYQDNREAILEYVKQYYQDNREARLEYVKQYRQDNAERIKQWRQDNAERIKQYRQDNREHCNHYRKERYKNDEQFRIRRDLSSYLRQSLKRVGKVKKSSILKYIGCSIKHLQNHLNSTKHPEWGDDLHIDHIIPCSLFDHTNEKEIKKCWNWRNLRYLPSIDNISKGNTLDLDLIRSYNIEDLLPEGTDV